jgi:hypothetical protein
MALTANFTRSAISEANSTFIDETTYGGANPARAAVAVWFTAYKVDEDLVETALVIDTFDPEVDSPYIVTNGIDGYHKYNFVIVDYWAGGTVYNQYDLVWSTAQQKFYEYINATPASGNVVTDPVYFAEVADPCAKIANVGTALESGNLIYQVIGKIVSYQTSICYIKAASKHAKENCKGADCGCDTRLGKLFHKIRDLFNNMGLNESTGEFIQGERNARLVEKWCDDCGCLTR